MVRNAGDGTHCKARSASVPPGIESIATPRGLVSSALLSRGQHVDSSVSVNWSAEPLEWPRETRGQTTENKATRSQDALPGAEHGDAHVHREHLEPRQRTRFEHLPFHVDSTVRIPATRWTGFTKTPRCECDAKKIPRADSRDSGLALRRELDFYGVLTDGRPSGKARRLPD